MFCPSCGTEYAIELKYCNRCGANLSLDLEQPIQPLAISVTKPVIVISITMTILTLLGFGFLLAGASELSRGAHIDPGAITAIVIVGMLTILTMDIFLVRLLSKLINAALSSGQAPGGRRPKGRTLVQPPQLQQPNPARLQSAPSVTENTTRFFEEYSGPRETEEPLPLKRS
jgi:hypothetical protein